jgi:mRNA interferase RelE/StbE
VSSAWTIELSDGAKRQLRKFDRIVSKRITRFLQERVSILGDPRQLGKTLRGDFGDYWSYRVGDYRILCEIHDDRLVVLVVAIGHRSEIYR